MGDPTQVSVRGFRLVVLLFWGGAVACSRPPPAEAPQKSGPEALPEAAPSRPVVDQTSGDVAPSPEDDVATPPSETSLGTIDGRPVILRFEAAGCEADPDADGAHDVRLSVSGAVPWALTLETAGVESICSKLAGSIVKEDFNFDGVEDFAVPIDPSGPYGSVTYRVFLFDRAARRHVEAPAFSELTTVHMGLFTTDRQRKRLVVSSKGGCCIHGRSEFSAHGFELVLEWSETITYHPGDEYSRCTVTTEVTKRGEQTRSTERPCTPEEL